MGKASLGSIVLYFFLGCLIVLVVTHAQGFSTATTAVGGQVAGLGEILTGNSVAQSQGTGGRTTTKVG